MAMNFNNRDTKWLDPEQFYSWWNKISRLSATLYGEIDNPSTTLTEPIASIQDKTQQRSKVYVFVDRKNNKQRKPSEFKKKKKNCGLITYLKILQMNLTI